MRVWISMVHFSALTFKTSSWENMLMWKMMSPSLVQNDYLFIVCVYRAGRYVGGKIWHLHLNNKNCYWQGIYTHTRTHTHTLFAHVYPANEFRSLVFSHNVNLMLSSKIRSLKAAWRKDILHSKKMVKGKSRETVGVANRTLDRACIGLKCNKKSYVIEVV